MEIPARFFFLYWGVIGFIFLKLGLDAMQSSELSDSVSPVLVSSLKFSLTVSSNCSFAYALGFNRHMKTSVNRYLLLYALTRSVFAPSYVIILYLIFGTPDIYSSFSLIFSNLESHLTTGAVRMLKLITLALLSGIVLLLDKFLFAVVAALEILALVHPHWEQVLMDKWLRCRRFVTDHVWDENLVISQRRSKMRKWVEFGVGMVGTILFQNFFRLTSFHQVVAFFCFAVVWLANMVLVSASRDHLGVFDFLLSNVVVGCTVSEYRLGGTTWIAYGAALVLYGLRLKLQSVVLVNREGEETKVVM